MSATLYALEPSHPSHAARLMLERKGIDHKVVNLLPGMHAAALRPLGFRQGTVPALKLDGRRIQGSRVISRALDEFQPEPRLFPEDPQKRIAVEEAERWGDDILQGIPRKLTRHLALTKPEMRRHMAAEAGVPAPTVIAAANRPVAWFFARKVGAGADDSERVARAVWMIPPLLDHVEDLISEGTIGGKEPNAADFQIGPSIRVLMSYEDLAPFIEGRRAGRFAKELLPDYPTGVPAGLVPEEWLAQMPDGR